MILGAPSAGDVAKVIEAITGLAWCLLAAMVLWKLFPVLRIALETRKVTVKVGGMELSFQEAAEQVEKQVAATRALGERVELLSARVDLLGGHEQARPAELARPPTAIRQRAVLWVDDTPRNNAYEIATLEGDGVQIVLAQSTGEAMRALEKSVFSLVITDMTREEGGTRVTDAGAQLIRRMREEALDTPVVVYTTRRKGEDWAERLRGNHAAVVWSQVDLLTLVSRVLQDPQAIESR